MLEPRYIRYSVKPGVAACCVSLILLGCASVKLPTQSELSNIRSGQQVILMFQVLRELKGKPVEAFGSSATADNIGFALADFETGGYQIYSESSRFFSEASKSDGWTYVLAAPGTVYLSFQPPQWNYQAEYIAAFNEVVKWRIQIPEKVPIVYAGTIFVASADYRSPLEAVTVSDNSVTARQIVDEVLPDLGNIETVLMDKHEGPLIFRSANAL